MRTGLAEKAFLATKNITIFSTNPAEISIRGLTNSSLLSPLECTFQGDSSKKGGY